MALLVGCSTEGRALERWIFLGTDIVLPASSLFGVLPKHEAYELTAEVDVPAGEPHTLILECFHGELVVRAGSSVLRDIGDAGVGEHRFVFSGAAAGPTKLTIEVRSDPLSLGFGTAPRLVRGEVSTVTPVAAFNRALALVDFAVIGVFTVLFGLSFALDRRRLQDLALAAGVALASVAPLAQLGLLLPLGRFAPAVIQTGICGVNISVVYFVHLSFRIGPPPRGLVGSFAVLGLTTVFLVAAEAVALLWSCALIVVDTWFFVHILRTLLAQRHGPNRRDALLLTGMMVLVIVIVAPDMWGFFLGQSLIGGIHTFPAGAIGFGLSQALYLAREQVARQRELEHTAEELRRQVAERSRELSEALGKLAQRATPLEADRTIDGRYRVIKKLGAGGMGTVYEVERLGDGRRLALKTLRGHADPDVMARFAREAQIAAEISHPHLVPVLDVGIADGGLFLVMPLVAGGSLEHARKRFGEAAWARPLLHQIADGLAALHARGIVHRDLKPANVLLADGVARIGDFGLAALGVDARGDTMPSEEALADTVAPASPLTRHGDVFGTPAYMAPELARGAKEAAPSSDIFAFGIVAFEMLTAERPFAEPPVVAAMHGRDLAAPARGDVPAIVARCLALDADQRPTAAELVDAFA